MSGLGEGLGYSTGIGKLLCVLLSAFLATVRSVDHCTRAAELKPATLYGHCRLKFPASTPPRECRIIPVS